MESGLGSNWHHWFAAVDFAGVIGFISEPWLLAIRAAAAVLAELVKLAVLMFSKGPGSVQSSLPCQSLFTYLAACN